MKMIDYELFFYSSEGTCFFPRESLYSQQKKKKKHGSHTELWAESVATISFE